ncbi:A/G-specific adenine glycosylase [Adhaeribacter pallidiroseus]|uniref:Adenine DNA glycosylase n=1 Tax=Adhaeribacter pallidiroseus TaxID=2072847 RepID=A0A369QVZ3_9BACT|nr:A/G-specific adenine glycosylase [Adhaeribacter pallidiroseus]RDC66338.1 putative A/G-specific adenine glycosylase YfhQ [Adhaeribacter pallidiroseus]
MLAPDPVAFANTLLTWYERHHRALPWRETRDPYAIWLSEIILQQTRVSQGLPYYLDFIAAYPTVQDLAAAPPDEVLRHWQGLGYYSRARNMHQTAKYITVECHGIFPNTYKGLLQLKGIGPYTAAAIASFAFKEKVAVVDGNVYRVLARVFGLAEDTASPTGKKAFQLLADSLISVDQPDTYNQAIMEFGAIQCTPNMPDCLFCPLQQGCYAFQHGLVQVLPHKTKAKASRTRYFHYLVFKHEQTYYLKKRTESDVWQGLYDFYLLPNDTEPALAIEIIKQELAGFHPPLDYTIIIEPHKTYKRILSHQKILAKFYLIPLKSRLSDEVLQNMGLAAYSYEEIEQLPKAVLISDYLQDAIKK